MVLWRNGDCGVPRLEQLVDKLLPDQPRSFAGGAHCNGQRPMMDYGELLRYLADNPPDSPAERRVHASMLELIATCMRDEHGEKGADSSKALAQLRARYSESGSAHSCAH